MTETVNAERDLSKSSRDSEPTINLDMIPAKIYECVKWLQKQARQTKCVAPVKIQAMRGAIYGYSVMVQALKDSELELKVRELQGIIENGVVIPGEQEPKKTHKRY